MKKGFSLPELLIAITITALVVEAAYFASRIGQATFKTTAEKIELAQNARVILDRMSREVRQATDIVTELPPGSDDPTDPPKNTIMFEDGHTTINRYISYNLENNNAYRTVTAYYFGTTLPDSSEWVVHDAIDSENNPPNSTNISNNLIAENITSLKIYGDSVIYIEMTASKDDQTADFATAVYPRN